MPAILSVSLSAVQAFRQCEQLYYYRHVERLRRKDRARAPQLGIVLHEYLGSYYQGLKDGDKPGASHSRALNVIDVNMAPECKRQAQQAYNAGANDLARQLLDLPDAAKRIAHRYHYARGRGDHDRYQILLVEESISIPMFKGKAVSNGRVDLVTRRRSDGMVSIWEHKSGENILSNPYKLRDLQTPLYRHKIEEMGLTPPIDSVIWNHIRTKEPAKVTTPTGKMSHKKNLDSTWEAYMAELVAQGLDLADFEDMRLRLEGREQSVFFPRYIKPIVSEWGVLFRDYQRSVRDIGKMRKAWQTGKRKPVRNLSLSCDWCEMALLCNAKLLAGDDSDVKLMRYTIGS